jgi:hypothetical protein
MTAAIECPFKPQDESYGTYGSPTSVHGRESKGKHRGGWRSLNKVALLARQQKELTVPTFQEHCQKVTLQLQQENLVSISYSSCRPKYMAWRLHTSFMSNHSHHNFNFSMLQNLPHLVTIETATRCRSTILPDF